METRAKKVELFIYGFLIILMVGVTSVLLLQTDEEAKNRQDVQEAFRSLLQLDLSLNENVLRARASLFESYDELSTNINGLYGTCGRLLNSRSSFMQMATEPMVTDLIDFCDEVKNKIDLAQKFKIENENLRKSLQEFSDFAQEFRDTPLESHSSLILAHLLELSFSASNQSSDRLHEEIQALEKAGVKYPRMQALVAQALQRSEDLLAKARQRDGIEKEILSGNVSGTLKKLEDSYRELVRQQDRWSLIFRIVLVVMCLLLLGTQFYLYRRLLLTSSDLQSLNRTLESKVEQRTVDLSDALTKLSEQQQMLVQSTKMTALGEMAGGMAHEINTPLAAIMLNAEMLQDQAENPNSAEIARLAEAIIRVTQRISKIVTGLRRFSRNSKNDNKERVAVLEIVDDTLSFCQEKFNKSNIQLSIDCQQDHKVLCSSEQICQVLLNLLNNAFDAIQERNPAKKWVRIESRHHDGKIEISVTDCGDGIPKEIRTKILQPFFTTKEIGKGTGLGLSISCGIIEEHGGQLRYDETCSNTRFVFSLPAATESESAA